MPIPTTYVTSLGRLAFSPERIRSYILFKCLCVYVCACVFICIHVCRCDLCVFWKCSNHLVRM